MGSAAAQANSNIALGSSLPTRPPSGTRACPTGLIRYGVFFDGTSNNAYSDWGGAFDCWGTSHPSSHSECQPPPSPMPANEWALPSENNAPTNVAKLHTLFIEKGDEQRRYYRIGVGGGTRNTRPGREPIRNFGRIAFQQSSGLGARGKINEAIAALTEFVNTQSNRLAIEKRVDVFGFSRGAAEARDFCNKVFASGIENRSKLIRYDYLPSPVTSPGGAPMPIRVPVYERMPGIIFEFLGVFDTVGSMGLGAVYEVGNTIAGYDFSVKGRPKDNTRKPLDIIALPCEQRHVPLKEGWVHRVFQCVADDEHRDLFPLEVLGRDPKTSQYKLLPENMREQSYPGAHGDIGGGVHSKHAKKAQSRWLGLRTTEAEPATFSHMSRLTLRDMHAEAKAGFVPLNPVSQLGDFGALEPADHEGAPALGGLYNHYCQLRRALILKHAANLPKYADYKRDILRDPVYLQALPDGVYQKICEERDRDPLFQQLSIHYISKPAEGMTWRVLDGIRRLVRIGNLPGAIINGRRDINIFSTTRQRDVHFMGYQNSYDPICSQVK